MKAGEDEGVAPWPGLLVHILWGNVMNVEGGQMRVRVCQEEKEHMGQGGTHAHMCLCAHWENGHL